MAIPILFVIGDHKSPGGSENDCEALHQKVSNNTHELALPPVTWHSDKFGGFLFSF
jgi:hypothetical protein